MSGVVSGVQSGAVLALDDIVKRFGDVTALAGASLTVAPGSVHALLGENGAGKTTLMRVAYGMTEPDSGGVRVDGRAVRLRSPADAIAAGIGMVHQHFTLVPAMTVAENVALGNGGRFDPATASSHVQALGRSTGLTVEASALVRDLPVSAQQRVELLKALSRHARILILDEPTAVLAPAEADDLLKTIRQLAASGRSVVLITHKLREALAVADGITVLRHGRTTLTTPPNETDESRLVTAMLGEGRAPATVPSHGATAGDPVIVAHDISVVDSAKVVRIRAASLTIRGGEIVGVVGVEGSGQRHLLRALAGRIRVDAGRIERPSMIGFVPDDRHRDGLVLEMSLVENFALRGAGVRRGRIVWDDLAGRTADAVCRFDVRAAGVGVPAGTLSGGNQQKFVLARELAGPPPALIAENPWRGLDVRASAEVQSQLLQARADGVATVLYSSDIDETLSIADRVLVVYAGSVRELPVDREAVGRAMLGAA